LAGWPDCGEWFAVVRLTICGEANTTKAKPALEGRALFGDEAPAAGQQLTDMRRTGLHIGKFLPEIRRSVRSLLQSFLNEFLLLWRKSFNV
jgi:hypothetical protein